MQKYLVGCRILYNFANMQKYLVGCRILYNFAPDF